MLVIAAGAASLLLTTGFVRDSFEGLAEAFITGGIGHLEVTPPSDRPDGELDRLGASRFAAWRKARDLVESTEHVLGATGTIVFHGLVSKGERSLPFAAATLEPDREARMGLRVRLRKGRSLGRAAVGEEEALLGLGLAQQLDAAEGDIVTLLSMTSDGMLNALDVRVVGLLTTGVQDLDMRFLRVHLTTAQRLLGTTGVDSIVVMLDDTARTEALAHELADRLRAQQYLVTIRDWRSRAPFYGQVQNLYIGIFGVLGAIVLVLVALSSVNALLMTVMERVPEIGALLAIGTSGGQMVQMIVLEACWLGLIGGLAGGFGGLATAAAVHELAITLPPPPGAVEPMPLRLCILAWDVVWVTALMSVVLGVAGLVPALRVLRMRIAEALVHH